jgi:hypothetical protein
MGSVARFLETRGKLDEALEIATDSDYKFDLAVQLGKLEIAKVNYFIPFLLDTDPEEIVSLFICLVCTIHVDDIWYQFFLNVRMWQI